MRNYIYISLIMVCTVMACQSNTTDDASKVVENTPEAVALHWLQSYFSNDFDAAKKYSTPPTQVMIDTIKNVIFTDSGEVEFNITALNCTTKADKASCTYVYVEDGEKIPENVNLMMIDSQWLVDAELVEDHNDPFLEENAAKMSEEIEAIIKEEN